MEENSINQLHDRSISPESWKDLSEKILELEKEQKEGIWTEEEVRQEIRTLMKEAFSGKKESIEEQQIVHFGALIERIMKEIKEKQPNAPITAINVTSKLDESLTKMESPTPFGRSPQDIIKKSFGSAEAAHPHNPAESLSEKDRKSFDDRYAAFCDTTKSLLSPKPFKNHELEVEYKTSTHSVQLSELEYAGNSPGKDRIITLEAITIPNEETLKKHGSNALTGLFYITMNIDKGSFAVENLLQEYGKKTTKEELKGLSEAVFRTVTGTHLPSEENEKDKEKKNGVPKTPHLKVLDGKPQLAIGTTEIGKILYQRFIDSDSITDIQSLKTFIDGLKKLNHMLYQENDENSPHLNLSSLPVALERKVSYQGKRLVKKEKEAMQYSAKLIQIWMAFEVVSAASSELKEEELWARIEKMPEFTSTLRHLRKAA